MVHFGTLVANFRNLAKEAEADERRVAQEIGRHRRVETKAEKVAARAHNTTKHLVHTIILVWAGLPAILAFETARPLWVKYVESPLSDVMVGTSHVEAMHTITTHFLG